MQASVRRSVSTGLSWPFRHSCLLAVIAAVMLFTAAVSSHAQTTSGTILGTVTDQSSAALANTTVQLINPGTNTKTQTKSNDSGYYQFFNVPPGTYRIVVQKEGFKQLTSPVFKLEVEGSMRINLSLEVGSESQTVTVTAAAPLIQAETTSLGSVVDERETTEIPLNGRNPMSLAAMVPSVIPQGQATQNPNGANPFGWGNYQIGGGMANQSATYLDGSPVNTLYINLTALIPTQDSLSEFKVDTNALSAEYGHLAGGAINFSTKSGTNDLHGSAWEYLRNKVLNANDYFSNQKGVARGAFTQNQYGFNVGGPVVIPRLYEGKNRTFFFFNWEGFALRQGETFQETAPTAAMINGDLSALGVTIYDPLTTCTNTAGCTDALHGANYGDRLPIPNADLTKAPVSKISPAAQTYIKTFYPAAPGDVYKVNNLVSRASAGGNNYEAVAKIDHNVSDKQHIMGRYTWWTNTNLPIDPMGTGICQDRCQEIFTTHDGVLNDTYAFNNTTVLDMRLSYLRFVYARAAKDKSFDFSTLGPGWGSISSGIQFPGPPMVAIQDFDTANTFGSGGADSTIHNASDNDRIAGTLTKMLGRHTLKFGGEWMRSTFNYAQTNNSAGQFTVTKAFTTANKNSGGGGAGLATFLLGDMDASSAGFHEVKPVAAEQLYAGVFATDDWRITNKLTGHFGLRWEDNYPWTERHNSLSYFDTGAMNPVLAANGINSYKGSVEVPNSATRSGRTTMNNFRKMFAPRLGLTYAPDSNTVVSFGYGLLWVPTDVGFQASPANDAIDAFTTPFNSSIDGGFTPHSTFDAPVPKITPAPGTNPSLVFGVGFQPTLLGTGVGPVFPDNPYAYAQQWNVGVQRQIGSSMALNVAYAGAKGTHLPFYQLSVDALPDSVFTPNYTATVNGHVLTGTAALQATVPNPFYGVINSSYGLGAQNVNLSSLLVKYPQYSNVSIASANYAGSTYNSLQIKMEKRFSGGASIGASYTFSKFLSGTDTLTAWLENGVSGAYGGLLDPNRPSLEKSLSANDVRGRFILNYVYDIPVGHGRALLSGASRPLNAIVGGWGVEGVTTLQSGFPLGIGLANGLNFGGMGQRPNQVAGCSKTIGGPAQKKLNGWFNKACFTAPAQFDLGNEPREDAKITAPGIANWDTAIFKDFTFEKTERIKLQFRSEFFNVFNRTQFGYPNANVGASNEGVIGGTVGNPRLVQFAMRVKF